MSKEQRATLNEDAEKHNRYLLAFATILVVAFWLVVFTYSLQAALPYSAFELPSNERTIWRVILPQGWNFFTRDPQETNILMFRRQQAGWENTSTSTYLNDSLVQLFGLRRSARAQGIELGVLYADIPDRVWLSCDELPENCLSEANEAVELINSSPTPTLCGTVGVVKQEPLPWAWRGAQDETVMPSEVARLDVSC